MSRYKNLLERVRELEAIHTIPAYHASSRSCRWVPVDKAIRAILNHLGMRLQIEPESPVLVPKKTGKEKK